METRPLSKTKNWRLVRVLVKAPQTQAQEAEALAKLATPEAQPQPPAAQS